MVHRKTRRPVAGRKARRPPKATSATAARRPATTSGLAPGMQAINTYLAVANVAASIAFLEQAFGFARGVVLPDVDGQLRYAEMRHGGSVVMLVRTGDRATATGGASALYTYVDDVDAQATRARAAGAGVADAEDRPWGDRVAVVTDPDGHRWALATFKKLVPFS
ncbi:MAG: VOC family protein [Vicinamibacterales bacterium]